MIYYFFKDKSFYQGFWDAPLTLVLHFSASASFVYPARVDESAA